MPRPALLAPPLPPKPVRPLVRVAVAVEVDSGALLVAELRALLETASGAEAAMLSRLLESAIAKREAA